MTMRRDAISAMCSSSPAQFRVLLGGELLHVLGTRWKLSWCYELARSFPVRGLVLIKALANRNAPNSPTTTSSSFFFMAHLFLHPLIHQAKNTHFSSLLPFFSFSLFFCPPYCTLALFSLWQNLDMGGYKSWSTLSMCPAAGPANR